MWLAQLSGGKNYGTWIPTGYSDFDKAEEYMEFYVRTFGGRVRDWILI